MFSLFLFGTLALPLSCGRSHKQVLSSINSAGCTSSWVISRFINTLIVPTLRLSDIFIHLCLGINTFQYHTHLLHIYLHTQHSDYNVPLISILDK